MTPQQTLELGLQQFRDGKFAEAQALVRQVLAQHPDQPDALHLLGLLAFKSGRNEKAAELISRAIELRPQAADLYINLGAVLNALSRLDEAEAALRKALALRSDLPEALSGLSDLLRKKKRLPEAVQAAKDALALRPDFADAANNLGSALGEQGNLHEAIAAFREAISSRPGFVDSHYNLAACLQQTGDLPGAISAYRHALSLNPNHVLACNGLGTALKLQGNLPEAQALLSRAVSLKPNFETAWSNLAGVLFEQGKWEKAIAAYQRALQINPNLVIAFNNLGVALSKVHRLKEAIEAYRKAIDIQSDFPETHTNLGSAYLDDGQIDLALQSFDRAFALRPEFPINHSNRIFILQFHPDFDSQAIFREASRWNDMHAKPLADQILPHENNRSPDRRLRIGFVSPHFYAQAESFFLLPLFREHDRREVEVIAFSSTLVADEITERMRAAADVWHDVRLLKDDALADQIRRDRIDILIDPTMHMGDNRLPVFARKPAPVQVTWLAYPGTTGLTTIDYRLTDPFIDPPGMFDQWYSEESIRLPQTWACFDPIFPATARAPRASGPITFGSLNNPCKMNLPTIRLWSRVLQAVKDSRLLILTPTPEFEERTRQAFTDSGIDPHRLEFSSRVSQIEFYRLHDRIDIALDPLPYNGITTTCSALWMGVPVITLIGQRAAGRASFSILANVGLHELVAHTPDEFVQISSDLAADLPRLQTYQATLRDRFLKSPIADARAFARDLESAYRQMWHRWCANK